MREKIYTAASIVKSCLHDIPDHLLRRELDAGEIPASGGIPDMYKRLPRLQSQAAARPHGYINELDRDELKKTNCLFWKPPPSAMTGLKNQKARGILRDFG
jgi:hypothetical protein